MKSIVQLSLAVLCIGNGLHAMEENKKPLSSNEWKNVATNPAFKAIQVSQLEFLGSKYLAAQNMADNGENPVVIYDGDTGKEARKFTGNLALVSMAHIKDNTIALGSNKDGTISTLELPNGQPKKCFTIPNTNYVTVQTMLPDNSSLIVFTSPANKTDDGSAMGIFDTKQKTYTPFDYTRTFQGLFKTPDSNYFVTLDKVPDGTNPQGKMCLSMWKTNQKKSIYDINAEKSAFNQAFENIQATAKYLIYTTFDGKDIPLHLAVHDFYSGKKIRTFKHVSRAQLFREKYCATITNDIPNDSTTIYDLETGDIVKKINLRPSLFATLPGKLLMAAGSTVQIYNDETFERERKISNILAQYLVPLSKETIATISPNYNIEIANVCNGNVDLNRQAMQYQNNFPVPGFVINGNANKIAYMAPPTDTKNSSDTLPGTLVIAHKPEETIVKEKKKGETSTTCIIN